MPIIDKQQTIFTDQPLISLDYAEPQTTSCNQAIINLLDCHIMLKNDLLVPSAIEYIDIIDCGSELSFDLSECMSLDLDWVVALIYEYEEW